MTKMKRVKTIGELANRARTDPNYRKLAMISASNLGGSPKDLDGAIHWLNINANETGSEDGVVDEINFCIDLV